MAKDVVTQYNVDNLVQARKIAMKAKLNTLYSSDPTLNERCLKVDIRRVDSTAVDLSLEFYPRVMVRELAGVRTIQRPSASLMWKGKRIRGLDHALKHEVVKDGVIQGYIKGWHEHYWTDTDEDSTIREPSPSLRNIDLQSVIAWCCKNWNIENVDTQAGLYS
jgi:hypothetical protein